MKTILYPVIAQAMLTFGIGLWFASVRIRAVRNGDINPGYFALNRGAKLPDNYLKVANNYSNLLEIPLLFYVIAILVHVSGLTDTLYLVLAWLYVGSRYIHSFIHTTYNNVLHRRIPFLAGVLVLILTWMRFALQIA